ncbi:hypothetical protein QTL97_16965 [Sporosarcina thermotolerans]|uniref:SMODS and SLOG-associating 2TM effector domain-containing protein n=1 Tax=Sporosarcina thermotolerans TaxID=633404 RepID=A0AAW9AC32_9BACL|nr:hypothetical protein [Sporosarcina thermotolerans]MDW0118619.1 hypothetical protein [Sporosarcina thermotolerans]WHT49587.1 hypothetical protein QNH10_08820 [Sporosarcina thermotolerans]
MNINIEKSFIRFWVKSVNIIYLTEHIGGILIINDYLSYLPIVIGIIVACLGYLFGQRSNKIERFYRQLDDNLNGLCGPMYFHLRRIFGENNYENREDYLIEFFGNFNSTNSNISKLGNKDAIEEFIKSEILFVKFKKSRNAKDWKEFWESLYFLDKIISDEYWENFNALYGEYRWFQKTLTSNPFIRFWNELIHISFQTSKFSVISALLFVYLCLWDKYNAKLYPEELYYISIDILSLVVTLFGFLLILKSTTYNRNQKRSIVKIILLKISPKLVEFWDMKVVRTPKKIVIPNMHNKHTERDN